MFLSKCDQAKKKFFLACFERIKRTVFFAPAVRRISPALHFGEDRAPADHDLCFLARSEPPPWVENHDLCFLERIEHPVMRRESRSLLFGEDPTPCFLARMKHPAFWRGSSTRRTSTFHTSVQLQQHPPCVYCCFNASWRGLSTRCAYTAFWRGSREERKRSREREREREAFCLSVPQAHPTSSTL